MSLTSATLVHKHKKPRPLSMRAEPRGGMTLPGRSVYGATFCLSNFRASSTIGGVMRCQTCIAVLMVAVGLAPLLAAMPTDRVRARLLRFASV